jgi:hypothetical protein
MPSAVHVMMYAMVQACWRLLACSSWPWQDVQGRVPGSAAPKRRPCYQRQSGRTPECRQLIQQAAQAPHVAAPVVLCTLHNLRGDVVRRAHLQQHTTLHA